jgi:hypothetical protein
MFRKFSLWFILLLALSACAPSVATPTAAPTQDIAATQTVEALANSQQVATSVAATLTAQPTDTPLPTSTDTPEPTPTSTPEPSATPTTLPTSTPTKVVVAATQSPSNTPAPTAGAASVYSTAAGGPQGYTSILGCTQANGAACQSVMAPGDISFSITLRSDLDAVLAIFLPFGLSVEKDGVNAADMYMTVDAGWLPPGSQARMGTSRNFNQPGRYVIRTNGCLLTEASYPNCTWWTVNGTIVTFDIQ